MICYTIDTLYAQKRIEQIVADVENYCENIYFNLIITIIL